MACVRTHDAYFHTYLRFPNIHPRPLLSPFTCILVRGSLLDLTSVCSCARRSPAAQRSCGRAVVRLPAYQCRVVTAGIYVYIIHFIERDATRRPPTAHCSAPAAAVVRRFSAELGTLGARPVTFRTRTRAPRPPGPVVRHACHGIREPRPGTACDP